MAKIHRSDAPLPQAPSVQVKASYTVTDLSKVSPQEPAAFYDQDNDEDYRRRETATPAPAGENVNPNGARFAALRDKNSDFIGWISIDGTNLDFPVMYAPDNKDFYLRHDFNKAYSVYGVPYLDEQTTLGANAESGTATI